MDTAHLSKIELGQRLPTEAQSRALASFFRLPPEDLEAKRIAERFWKEHEGNPVATKAVSLLRARTLTNIRSQESRHRTKRRATAGSGDAIQ